MSSPDFAKGASGPENQYAGLGLNLAYLGGAHASASATAGSGTTGTSFPSSPSDAQLYTYVADGTNGVLWTFRWYTTGAYWAFVGGPPLMSRVDTSESVASATYAAIATAGPSVALPFAADYDIAIGMSEAAGVNSVVYMSYDIGGTGAVDADSVHGIPGFVSVSRLTRKTGLTAVTLTAKYRYDTSSGSARYRWMAVTPVKK